MNSSSSASQTSRSAIIAVQSDPACISATFCAGASNEGSIWSRSGAAPRSISARPGADSKPVGSHSGVHPRPLWDRYLVHPGSTLGRRRFNLGPVWDRSTARGRLQADARCHSAVARSGRSGIDLNSCSIRSPSGASTAIDLGSAHTTLGARRRSKRLKADAPSPPTRTRCAGDHGGVALLRRRHGGGLHAHVVPIMNGRWSAHAPLPSQSPVSKPWFMFYDTASPRVPRSNRLGRLARRTVQRL